MYMVEDVHEKMTSSHVHGGGCTWEDDTFSCTWWRMYMRRWHLLMYMVEDVHEKMTSSHVHGGGCTWEDDILLHGGGDMRRWHFITWWRMYMRRWHLLMYMVEDVHEKMTSSHVHGGGCTWEGDIFITWWRRHEKMTFYYIVEEAMRRWHLLMYMVEDVHEKMTSSHYMVEETWRRWHFITWWRMYMRRWHLLMYIVEDVHEKMTFYYMVEETWEDDILLHGGGCTWEDDIFSCTWWRMYMRRWHLLMYMVEDVHEKMTFYYMSPPGCTWEDDIFSCTWWRMYMRRWHLLMYMVEDVHEKMTSSHVHGGGCTWEDDILLHGWGDMRRWHFITWWRMYMRRWHLLMYMVEDVHEKMTFYYMWRRHEKMTFYYMVEETWEDDTFSCTWWRMYMRRWHFHVHGGGDMRRWHFITWWRRHEKMTSLLHGGGDMRRWHFITWWRMYMRRWHFITLWRRHEKMTFYYMVEDVHEKMTSSHVHGGGCTWEDDTFSCTWWRMYMRRWHFITWRRRHEKVTFYYHGGGDMRRWHLYYIVEETWEDDILLHGGGDM